MKIAVLSDIHGNLEAFNAVLDSISLIKPERVISLGDNVGYGADSEKVTLLLERNKIVSVLGNHEFAVLNKRFINWFNPDARLAVTHTIENLSPVAIEIIKNYKKSLVIGGVRFVHGVPVNAVALYLHQLSDKKLMRIMDKTGEPLCFTGHTHNLGLIEYDGERLVRKPLEKGMTILNRKNQYIVNSGSVGQPRDGDRRAKFLLFDSKTYSIDVRYVEYENGVAAKKIIDSGLPAIYAERLL